MADAGCNSPALSDGEPALSDEELSDGEPGPSDEKLSWRRALAEAYGLDPPLTELDLQEIKAEAEGWGDEFRTELFKREREEANDEARERQEYMRRKKEESRFAEESAETARQRREIEGMRVNDPMELQRQQALDDMAERILAWFTEE